MYFTSKATEIIFYLVELDGKTRADKLNISMKHYSSKKNATAWKENILEIINAESEHPMYPIAIEKLEQLYNDMIE